MLHLICKVFYVSNQLQMCPFLMEQGALDPWMGLFRTILDMPCPDDLIKPTEETQEIVARDKSIYWKIKSIVWSAKSWPAPLVRLSKYSSIGGMIRPKFFRLYKSKHSRRPSSIAQASSGRHSSKPSGKIQLGRATIHP
mgnify:CR=1 FL=1